MKAGKGADMSPRWVRPLAWGIIVLVTAFWLWFGIASAAAERLGPMNWLGHLVVPGGVLVVTALVAWRWPIVGASLLIAEGLFVAVAYPLTFGRRFPAFTTVMVLLTMAAPPVIAGSLLIVGRWHRPSARA
jgi:hypothetical protein